MKYGIISKSIFLWPDLLVCTLWCWAILGDRYIWSSPTEFIALVAVFLRISVAFLLQKSEIRTWLPLGVMSGCLGLLMGVSTFPGLDTLVRYPFVLIGTEQWLEPDEYLHGSILIAAWLWGLPVIVYLVQLCRRKLRKTELTWREVFGSILWKERKAQFYAILLLVSLVALHAGLAMDARVCRLACLAAPAVSYWMLCRHCQIKGSRTGWMIVSMLFFYYAQFTCELIHFCMLCISLAIIIYLGVRFFRKSLRPGPLLAIILYIGIGLPSMAIGYNQYIGLEYARPHLGTLAPYHGIFLIENPAGTHYGLRDRYGILIEPEYKNIVPHQTAPALWYQELKLIKENGQTYLYDLWEGTMLKELGTLIPTEERIIIPQEDLRAYFDSLCQHTEARLWIHRQDDPDTMKVWEAIDELTLFARGEQMYYPNPKVQKALQLMGLEQAYLESHGGWWESSWNNEGLNPGELFLSHFLKKAARYCPRMELLAQIHSEDKKVGVINFPSWGNQPFQAVLLYQDGKGLGTIPVTNGEFAPTKITEITRVENAGQNLYLLHTSMEGTFTFDLDRKQFISPNPSLRAASMR